MQVGLWHFYVFPEDSIHLSIPYITTKKKKKNLDWQSDTLCCLCLNDNDRKQEGNYSFLGCLNHLKDPVLLVHCDSSKDISLDSSGVLLISLGPLLSDFCFIFFPDISSAPAPAPSPSFSASPSPSHSVSVPVPLHFFPFPSLLIRPLLSSYHSCSKYTC